MFNCIQFACMILLKSVPALSPGFYDSLILSVLFFCEVACLELVDRQVVKLDNREFEKMACGKFGLHSEP